MSTTTTRNTTTVRSTNMITVRPFIGQTEAGFPFQGFACLTNGYWATRSNGFHIWAMSEAKAHDLASKAAGQSSTTPASFVEWGTLPARGTAPAARPAPAVQTPGPFAQGASPAPHAAARPVPQQAAVSRPRSAAQCGATLRLTSSNAMRCERGEIGGDLGKMRKGVLTALANYRVACGREGIEADEELVENALHAAGADLADSEAV